MKLNQALAKLKNLKSRLSRVEKCIEECVIYYEDETPAFVYKDELQKRDDLLMEILSLKEKIQVANATTIVKLDGKDTSLAGLILMNANIRSNMAFIAKQIDKSTNDKSRYAAARSKDQVKKVFSSGYDKTKFRLKLDDLEAKKEKIEEILATANSSTDLP